MRIVRRLVSVFLSLSLIVHWSAAGAHALSIPPAAVLSFSSETLALRAFADPREGFLSGYPEVVRELTEKTLSRVGEGAEKEVFASDHWVVKRVRNLWEGVVLVWLSRIANVFGSVLPGPHKHRFISSLKTRDHWLNRVFWHGLRLMVFWMPEPVLKNTSAARRWLAQRMNATQGEALTETLRTKGWFPTLVHFEQPLRVTLQEEPFFLVVTEAEERVETTLHAYLISHHNDGDSIRIWLNRFIDLHQAFFDSGVMNLDRNLKNYGMIGNRLLLIDYGFLSNSSDEIVKSLQAIPLTSQHWYQDLESLLRGHPALLEAFDARWHQTILDRAT